MIFRFPILALAACLIASCEKQIIPAKSLFKEEQFRASLIKAAPDLETISYLFDGHVIFGLFRSESSHRYLIVLQPPAVGKLNLSIGGLPQEMPLDDPLRVTIAGILLKPDGTEESDYNNTSEVTLGYWLTIPDGTELLIDGSISHPADRKIHLSFTPPNTISASLVPIENQSEPQR